MASPEKIDYKPSATVREFIKDYTPGKLFYDWIVGPVGSGKTTGIFFKLVYMAGLQQPDPQDGIRRTKAVIVRNTMPQLKDTTIASWGLWFRDGQAGSWHSTTNRFVLRFGDVECEVLFRPLDTPDDVARVLSLDVTFVLVDEFVEIPRPVIDALSARCGRFPKKKYSEDGVTVIHGATNWGMWGSSNPETEDNWWFEFLHSPDVERIRLGDKSARQSNVRYYLQPSGLSPEAENLAYLPGGRDYYTSQLKGKSEAWVKQFIEAEWGFSIAGKPVVATFKPVTHISAKPISYNPLLPLVIGFDPGLAGSAMVFGQEDHQGRLLVLGELVQSNYGARRLISDRLKPYLRLRFPQVGRIIVAPDPAAQSRTNTDERTVVDEFKRHFEVKAESNNRLPLRLDAIDHFATRLTEGGPALIIDEKQCPVLIRALKGGWRFAMDTKKDAIKGIDPEKNPYSHVGDAFGYLCRYFHRITEREERYSGRGKSFKPPLKFGSNYHVQ